MAGDDEEAERRIARVKLFGWKRVFLRDLDIQQLPSNIEKAIELRYLNLSGCSQLKDVSALGALTGLQTLYLDQCS